MAKNTRKSAVSATSRRAVLVREDLGLLHEGLPKKVYLDPGVEKNDLKTRHGNPKPLLVELLRHLFLSHPKKNIDFTHRPSALLDSRLKINLSDLHSAGSNYQTAKKLAPGKIAKVHAEHFLKKIDPKQVLAATNGEADTPVHRELLNDYTETLKKVAALEFELESQNLDLSRKEELLGFLKQEISKTKKAFNKSKEEHEQKLQEKNLKNAHQAARLKRLNKKLKEVSDQASLNYYKGSVAELQGMLAGEPLKEILWQEWIERNHWVLGTRYPVLPPQKEIEIDGARLRLDLVVADENGFIDVIEIKTPYVKVLKTLASRGSASRGGKISRFTWSREANEAIGQLIKYLTHAQSFRSEFERQFRAYRWQPVAPRGTVIIGREIDWTEQESEGLRLLNHFLNGIEVITFDELLRRAERIVTMLEFPRNLK